MEEIEQGVEENTEADFFDELVDEDPLVEEKPVEKASGDIEGVIERILTQKLEGILGGRRSETETPEGDIDEADLEGYDNVTKSMYRKMQKLEAELKGFRAKEEEARAKEKQDRETALANRLGSQAKDLAKKYTRLTPAMILGAWSAMDLAPDRMEAVAKRLHNEAVRKAQARKNKQEGKNLPAAGGGSGGSGGGESDNELDRVRQAIRADFEKRFPKRW